MRLVTFRKGKHNHLGVLIDDHVADIVAATRASGGPDLPTDMTAFLALGTKGLRAAKRAARFAAQNPKRGLFVPLSRVRLEAPIPNPPKLLALAGNYAAHVAESGKKTRPKREQTPRVFMKPPSTTVNRPGGTITLTRFAHFVDWEVELAIVIGRKATDIKPADAPRHIAGYTIINDISERQFRIRKRPESLDFDRFFDWLNGKWGDGFAPMGPCLVTADEIPDPHSLHIALALNGKTMQDASTSDMVFTCPEIVAYISRFVTLEPGDVIATGTPAGIGYAQGRKLRAGDTLRAEIEGIGVLENTLVRPPKAP